MPAYVQPPLPPEVRAIVAILGANQIRVAVILNLAAGPTTVPALARDLGVRPNAVLHHLHNLEAIGGVTASLPRGRRRGATVTWTLNREAVRAELEQLLAAFA